MEYFKTENGKLYLGNCLNVMKDMEDNSIDTIITDPPYGLKFMGKKWDYDVPSIEIWKECLRVCKPGATMLCFAGTRTQHRMAVNIEDAGWILKDCIMWLYGSGFPKATDISKQLDKMNGESGRILKFVKWFRTTGLKQKETNRIIEMSDVGSHYLRLDQPAVPTAKLWAKLRPYIKIKIPKWVDELVDRIEAKREVIGKGKYAGKRPNDRTEHNLMKGFTGGRFDYIETKPPTPEAKLWEGWKSHGLKPAYEPILVAMKPNDGTYAENALKWGVSGLNIDGGRIEVDPIIDKSQLRKMNRSKKDEKTGWE